MSGTPLYSACRIASPHTALAESTHVLLRDAIAAAKALPGAHRGWAVIRIAPDSAPYANDGRRTVAAASEFAARCAADYVCDLINSRLNQEPEESRPDWSLPEVLPGHGDPQKRPDRVGR